MPRFNEMPPAITTWPKPVAKIATELARLQEEAAQANRNLARLTGDDTPGARDGILVEIRKADEAALSEAARKGTTLPTTRPATEQHELDVEAARTAITATEGAVNVIGAELQAALHEHAEAIDAAVTAQTTTAADSYMAAINALQTARIEVKHAAATDGFLQIARRATGDRWVNFASSPGPDMVGAQSIHGGGDFNRIVETLRAEADHYRPDEDDTLSAA